jgi:hypothetical protein
MIIWGWRGREIEQTSGQFYCPQCDSEQNYQHLRVATYFTLYFIPLFETEHHGDYVQCRTCRGQFKLEVLDYKPPSNVERMLLAIRSDLISGTPIQMGKTKLLHAGIEEEVAEKIISAVAGENQRRCSSCNLTFVKEVSRCSSCGANL